MQVCLYCFHLVAPNVINVPKKKSNRSHFYIQSDWFLYLSTLFYWKIIYILSRTWKNASLLTTEFSSKGLMRCWQLLMLVLLNPFHTIIHILSNAFAWFVVLNIKDYSGPVMNKFNLHSSPLCFPAHTVTS